MENNYTAHHLPCLNHALSAAKTTSKDKQPLVQPFFLKHGFRQLDKNVVERNGELLLNFTMEKWLNVSAS
ncbi:hypothetical protein L9G15_00570 [Shewanella sp. A3A]|nr:hypothetical protein [Shewanella ferrihydritica]